MSDERPYVLHRVSCPALTGAACDCDGSRLLDELLAAAADCSAEGQDLARERRRGPASVRRNPVFDEMLHAKRLRTFDRLRKSAALASGNLSAAGPFRGFSRTVSGLHVAVRTDEPEEP